MVYNGYMKRKILLADLPQELRTLQSKSSEVTDFGPETQQLVEDMFDSMKAANGIGLSAIQIGVPKRIMIAEYEEAKSKVPRMVLINPEITWASKKEVADEEGCLSFPNIYGLVRRPEKIGFKAHDSKGNVLEAKVGGLAARVIQHEIDHLNGVLFVEKVEGDLYTYEKEDDTEQI
jgi:peptide deformylase